MATPTAIHDDEHHAEEREHGHVGGDDQRDVDEVGQLELQQRQRRGEDDEDGDEDRPRRCRGAQDVRGVWSWRSHVSHSISEQAEQCPGSERRR